MTLPGVIYHGPVDHITLKYALLNTSFLLYPTMFPETGCITVLKAMYYGAIPITSRYKHSVLFNLTQNYDLGPEALTNSVAENKSKLSRFLLSWTDSVVRQ